MLAKYTKTEINDNFLKLKDYYFDYPNKKDIVLIKLLLNARLFISRDDIECWK